MNRLKALKVIREYLSRSSSGALIVDTAHNTLLWTMDSNAISHSYFVVVDAHGSNDKCECGEYYNDECEQCSESAVFLLEKIENVLV